MIGILNPGDPRVTVIGAGIAGLLLADALERAGFEVRLYEREARAGGLLATRQTEFGPAESAAHSLLVGPEARALFERLGVELVPVRQEARARFILREGRLRKLPLGPLEAAQAFLRAYFVLARPTENQTLAAWADRHLGVAAREYLLAPFVRGIYGADPEQLDLELAFPALKLPPGHSLVSYRLHKLRKQERCARPVMMAPAKGLGALVEALRERLGDRVQLGRAVEELPMEGNIALAVPAFEAARLLERQDPALAESLRAISYTPLVSITVFAEMKRPPRGVGVLIPRRESARRILGVLFNSSSFPGRAKPGFESLTVMLGGQYAALDDGAMKVLLTEELQALFGDLKTAHTEIHRWPRAIPRYDRTLGQALAQARQGWCAKPGRILFGNYTGQVSLRGMIETVARISTRTV